jgi:hypothetical protein
MRHGDEGDLNNPAVLRASAENQKEPTRALPYKRQSLFLKPKSEEKIIPHSNARRIQVAVAGLDPWSF